MAHSGKRLLEICVDSPAGVAAAIAGGADRIELCSALASGGLTPSAGLVDIAVAACADAGVAVRGMVRPRGGDFAYDKDDLTVAIADAKALLTQGIDGLVFGAARKGRLDGASASRWLNAVRDATGAAIACTFHRAIDLIDDPVDAATAIADLGFDTILTSGGATTASEGATTIRAMIERAGRAITIMPGSGITAATAPALLATTGAAALHASASRPNWIANPRVIELGFAPIAMRATDEQLVRSLREALDSPIPIVQLG